MSLRRVTSIGLLAFGILAGPLTAAAQQPGTVFRIGFLSGGATPSEAERPPSVLRQALQGLGYV